MEENGMMREKGLGVGGAERKANILRDKDEF